MKEVIQEPGFWLMIFGTIIIAMILFVPAGNYGDGVIVPEKTVVVEECAKDCEPVLNIEKEAEAVARILLVLRNGGM